MTQVKRFCSVLLTIFKRVWKAVRSQPFGVLALVCGVCAAVLAPGLVWRLAEILNALNLAVARRLAGTGSAELASVRAETLALLGRTALTMALYLTASRCALHGARKLRDDLHAAVQTRRAAHEEEGHTPPPDWETDVGRDIDRIAAMTAAVPEWLMLLAGIALCVTMLVRAPVSVAVAIPITAVILCIVRDLLRQRGVSQTVQALAMSAVWIAGTLITVLRAVQYAEPVLPLGMICALLLGAALIIPATLQLPYRSFLPAWTSMQRVRGFLK